ncbi:MAG: S-formylglutathione hydrolase [Burkholderiaceae bacterium]
MIEAITSYCCFGGTQGYYCHPSSVIGSPMKFGVYRPDGCERDAPALIFLAGLTCTEDTFAIKAGAQRYAAEHGLVLVTPDTSPRDTGFTDAKKDWDFGEGAGFYLDATEAPWSQRFRMESWIMGELIDALVEQFGIDRERLSIFGHSMGGHGALTLALRHPGLFRSVSAFAPIVAPMKCPWGQKAFTGYLGSDRSTWEAHDASALMQTLHRPYPQGILIDQGLADNFLEQQLYPEAFEAACRAAEQPLTLRRHAGYDHGYYFISTFVGEHIAFHADALR